MLVLRSLALSGLVSLCLAACVAVSTPMDAPGLDGDSASSDVGAAPSDAGADGGAPLLAPCTTNSDCASMLCHYYPGVGGSFCTKPCTTAADCPPPSPGCNGMGVCRIH
jgi:hypothetical protein